MKKKDRRPVDRRHCSSWTKTSCHSRFCFSSHPWIHRRAETPFWVQISNPPPQAHFLRHLVAPALAIPWPFTLSLGHPIHSFFIKLQRSLRLISCGSWWNGEPAGSFPEAGRGWEGCQRWFRSGATDVGAGQLIRGVGGGPLIMWSLNLET